MKKLTPIWFIESPCDYEHKTYILLAYIQHIEKEFKNNVLSSLYDVKYHSKNIECFLTIRSLLELRDMPSPTVKQREHFKKITSKPDDDKDLQEVIKIAKWSLKKLQDVIKKGSVVFKKIESNLQIYAVGKLFDKSTGYLIVRYAGSHVFEVYKFIYDRTFKDVTFTLFKYYDDIPAKSGFVDVKGRVLEDENKTDDLFIAVESHLSYDTRKSLFPVLNHLFPTKIFNKNLLGLSY